MVILERYGIGRISERKRSKIYNLYHCLKLLSIPIYSQTHKKINKVAASYDLGTKGTRNHILNLTMHDAYEAISLILDDTSQGRTLDHISTWVLKCQRQGGFGIWPTSSPRLYSTYQAISILRDVELLDKCKADLHISWIKRLQQPGGSFKGPWSKRELWEDTFYATQSLNMLGSSLNTENSHLCQTWSNGIFTKKGIKKSRPDIIYYCFSTLDVLGAIDDNIVMSVSNWLLFVTEQLLLTNITLNYENVHFIVMIYHILKKYTDISPKHLELMTGRIQTVFDAELANIRI